MVSHVPGWQEAEGLVRWQFTLALDRIDWKAMDQKKCCVGRLAVLTRLSYRDKMTLLCKCIVGIVVCCC